jgi:tripartite-type tricarboxylate transporter receptor subunit TctC
MSSLQKSAARMRRQATILGAAAALAAACAGAQAQTAAPTTAQSWPTRPLTMVVPFAPGGAVDVMGRILAAGLSEVLGHQVIIDNVGGAGGQTGSYRVAKAAPDGYEMVLGSVGTHAQSQSLYKKPLYNAATDFAPVALIAELPLIVVARKSLPANDLPGFIAYAKMNQAKMQYGSAGVGSADHLTCVLLNATIGIDITHVPYRGGQPAMQDLIAGRIDYVCNIITTVLPEIEAGLIKPIAITTRERSPLLPDLASADEQGLKGFDAYTWDALFLPKGAPDSIVRRLNAAVTQVLNTRSVAERLKAIGASIMPAERRTPEYLGKFVPSEIEKWAGPIKASGASVD